MHSTKCSEIQSLQYWYEEQWTAAEQHQEVNINFLMVAESGPPGRNTHKHRENMQTAHRMAPARTGIQIQNRLDVRRQC